MLFKVILLLALMVVYDFLTNLVDYLKSKRLLRIAKKDNAEEKLLQHKQTFLKLTRFVMDYSHLKEYVNEMTMTPIVTHTTVKKQFPSFGTLSLGIDMLTEAAGHYKSNIFSALNPLSWMNKFITLPGQIIGYVGFKHNSTISKILNIIWWVIVVIWWFFTPIAEDYRERFLDWFKTLTI